MTKVFLVTHTHDLSNGEEDMKFVGVFATETEAQSAVERAKRRPGFSDTPGGFHVEAYELGKEHWTEGFVTWTPAA